MERRRVSVSYVRVNEEHFAGELVWRFETENLDVWMDGLKMRLGPLRGATIVLHLLRRPDL